MRIFAVNKGSDVPISERATHVILEAQNEEDEKYLAKYYESVRAASGVSSDKAEIIIETFSQEKK